MIELRGVTKTFGARKAVDHLDLGVRAGELFAFLGPNGAGKTTTIKMVCGLLRPTSGVVRVGGYPAASPEARKGFRADYLRIVTERTDELVAETPAIYARYFSAEELKALVAFYRSPVGRKSLAVMPAIVGDMVRITTERLPLVTAEITEAFRRKMRAKGVEIPI